jgi:hypothetical protein
LSREPINANWIPGNQYTRSTFAELIPRTQPQGVLSSTGTRSAKISEAERLGIPKGERNQWLRGTTADAAWDTGLGLNNPNYMQHLTDLHFKLAAPKT